MRERGSINTINSLSPGRYGCDFNCLIFKCSLVTDLSNHSSGIVFRHIPHDYIDDKSTMGQVMAWCNKSLPEPMLTQILVTIWYHPTTMSQHIEAWTKWLPFSNKSSMMRGQYHIRADSRLAPSQWETSLQSNAVSHWLGANLESTLSHPYSPLLLS